MFGPKTSHAAVAVESDQSGLGFGCMGITAFYGASMSDEDCMELLKTVYDAGCRSFDTAEVYKSGNPAVAAENDIWNEGQLGKFLATVPRDSYTVATKYFPALHDPEGKITYDSVKSSLVKSLERLGLEYVDLYYCHRIPSLDEARNFVRVAQELKKEGLIKAIGLSEISAEWLREVHAIAPIDAVQQEWSLMTRNLEDDLVPTCAELGITLVAYSPFARGLLAKRTEDTPQDYRAGIPRFQGDSLKKNMELYDKVEELAKKKGSTTAQLSLAWLFHRASKLGVSVMPIPGTTKIANALSNIASLKISISDEESKLLESLAEQVVGDRYDEMSMKRTMDAQKA